MYVCVSTAPSAPTINIETSRDSVAAGDSLNLTCSAMIIPNNLITDPILTWSGPGVYQNSIQLHSGVSTLSISFSPLRTSHGGVYVCDVSLSIPEAEVNVSATKLIAINVQSELLSFNITVDLTCTATFVLSQFLHQA